MAWAPLAAPVAAGCGSDEKPTPSKAEFLRKGNAVCAAGNKQIEAEANKRFRGQQSRPSDAELRKFATEVLLPSIEKQVSQLRDLGAPKGDEAKVKAILDAAQQGVDKGKQDPLSLTRDKADPFARANSLARQYGLNVCGS
jgi:hypothetical protein